jgi:hypothetical protein
MLQWARRVGVLLLQNDPHKKTAESRNSRRERNIMTQHAALSGEDVADR